MKILYMKLFFFVNSPRDKRKINFYGDVHMLKLRCFNKNLLCVDFVDILSIIKLIVFNLIVNLSYLQILLEKPSSR